MIRANADTYPVSAQCKILGVAKSTYYWMSRHPAGNKPKDPLTDQVVAIFNQNHKRYGAGRIRDKLHVLGINTSRRRIRKIMISEDLVSRYNAKKKYVYRDKPNEADSPNVLDRQFKGYAPRTHIVGDLTFVKVRGENNYVCLLVDLYNREIVGHSVGGRKTAKLVKAAFATLEFPLFDIECLHTDRGSEFANREIDEMLEVFGIGRSLSRKGNPWDNAVIESTNHLIKTEELDWNVFQSTEHLRQVVNDYVWWYNNERLHGTLGNMSPVDFRMAGLSL